MHFPRISVRDPKCGAYYCTSCARKFIKSRNELGEWPSNCAFCRGNIKRSEFQPVNKWDIGLSKVFRRIVIQCANKCGYSSSPDLNWAHETRECPARMIKCPNDGCNFEGKASDVENAHYPTCPQYMQYCKFCCTPLPTDATQAHNCGAIVFRAFTGMKFLLRFLCKNKFYDKNYFINRF